MAIQLIADSCCDTTPELKKRLGIRKAPLKVKVGERLFVDDDAIRVPELLAAMKAEKAGASSACPSPEEFAAFMREAEECVVITLSAKLSGSYNAARVARDMVMEDFPEKKIHIFDSKSAAAGELLLALYLKARIDAGDDFETLVQKGEAHIRRTHTLFVLEDLSNFVKSGRLNKVSGVVASILSLCPVMGDDGNGEIRMVSKARGNRNALSKMIDLIAQETADVPGRTVRLVMTYCNCPERAVKLRSDLLERCPAIREVIMSPTGGLSTMYAGDGGIVIAYGADKAE